MPDLELDAIDWNILDRLQRDASLSHVDLVCAGSLRAALRCERTQASATA